MKYLKGFLLRLKLGNGNLYVYGCLQRLKLGNGNFYVYGLSVELKRFFAKKIYFILTSIFFFSFFVF